jgi:hypothetical protein
MNKIRYKGGYKYKLEEDYVLDVRGKVLLLEGIDTKYIRLDTDGTLIVKEGYAWDGPSGPTFDTKNFMRGSLVHDVFYQLIRDGYLVQSFRKVADILLYNICREDGMWYVRAWWVYLAVRIFGKTAADPSSNKPVEEAP